MSPRRTLIVLVVSLAVNLFLIGLLVGGTVVGLRMAETRHAQANAVGVGRAPLAAAAQGLAPDRRPQFRAVLREALLSTRPDVQRARVLRREALAMTERPQFDPAEVSASLARARALEVGARGKVEDAVIAYAATLPQAERAEFTKALREALIRPQRPRRRQGAQPLPRYGP